MLYTYSVVCYMSMMHFIHLSLKTASPKVMKLHFGRGFHASHDYTQILMHQVWDRYTSTVPEPIM